MANTALPSLSQAGWIVDPVTKADRMMAHFYAANKSQGALYTPNAVISLPWLCQKYGHDIPKLCKNAQDALTDYFNRYFDSCEVDITASWNGVTAAGKVTLHLKLIYRVGTTAYDLERNLVLMDGKFDEILTANEQGL